MKRLIVWGTVLAGATAAYLMFRRGESFSTIARQTAANPLGTFAREIKNAL